MSGTRWRSFPRDDHKGIGTNRLGDSYRTQSLVILKYELKCVIQSQIPFMDKYLFPIVLRSKYLHSWT